MLTAPVRSSTPTLCCSPLSLSSRQLPLCSPAANCPLLGRVVNSIRVPLPLPDTARFHVQESFVWFRAKTDSSALAAYPHSATELMGDVLLWTPTHGRAKAGRPARTCIQQLCEDTGCFPEDLPRAMNDRKEWRERVRDIRATSAIWWWWWYKTQRVINICARGADLWKHSSEEHSSLGHIKKIQKIRTPFETSFNWVTILKKLLFLILFLSFFLAVVNFYIFCDRIYNFYLKYV